MTVLTLPGVSIDTLQSLSAPFIATASRQWMFASNGWRACERNYVPGASALYGVSEKWFISDDYWTFAPRWLLANWRLTTAGAGGQEAANVNDVTVEAFSLQIGRNGAPTQIAINGSTAAYTLVNDTEIWTDAPALVAIPPRTPCCIRVAWSVPSPTASLLAPAQGYHPGFGDKVEVSTSSLASKVMAGGISTTAPSGNSVYPFGPIGMVAQGWDGRPVGLIVGTSIEQGVGTLRTNVDRFGAQGPAEVGLVSADIGLRYPVGNWAISGGLAAGIIGIGANQGLTRRMRAIAALPNIPFTFTHSGFGTNDQNATLATWQTTMTTTLQALRDAWPAQRLVQSELWSRLASSTDAFTTQANQTLSSNWSYPGGSAWGLTQYFRDSLRSSRLIDGFAEIMDVLDNGPGGGARGKWRADMLDASFATTVAAAYTANAGSISITARPYAGQCLAFLTTNPDSQLVYSVNNDVTPFQAQLAAVSPLAHSVSDVVKEALGQSESSGDKLVHPGEKIARYVGVNAYGRAKLAGLYG